MTAPDLSYATVLAQRNEAVRGLERIRDKAGRSGFSSMVAAEYHLARTAWLATEAQSKHTSRRSGLLDRRIHRGTFAETGHNRRTGRDRRVFGDRRAPNSTDRRNKAYAEVARLKEEIVRLTVQIEDGNERRVCAEATPWNRRKPQPDAAGWILWHGGECPVPDGTPFQFHLRAYSRPGPSELYTNASHWRWTHAPGVDPHDIIAYRIVPGDGT